MQYALRAKNIELSALDEQLIQDKLNRLGKYVTLPYTADVSLEHDTHHLKGNTITCRINIEQGKRVFHAERIAPTIADALDEVIHAMQQELRRNQDKHREASQHNDLVE